MTQGLVMRVPLAPIESGVGAKGEPMETLLRVSDEADTGSVNEAALVEGARAGDEEALRQLLGRAYPLVRRWTAAHGAHSSEVEDVTQDVMVLIVRKLPSFRGECRFTSWLYRVARNAWIDRSKAHRRRERLAATLDSSQVKVDDQATSPLENPDAVLEQKAVRERIVRAFGALSPRQREVLDLADVQGFSSQEAAEMLGVKASTVRVTLLNARRALRLRLLELDPDLAEEFGHEL